MASYLGGMLVYSIDPEGGALAPITSSPFDKGAELLAVAASASGQFVYATDYAKGLRSYAIAPEDGRLSPLTSEPIALPATVDGPIAIDPQDRFLYVSAAAHLYTFRLGADGVPSLADVSPPALTGIAYIATDPAGHFLYVEGGPDGIVGYDVHADTGALTPLPGASIKTGQSLSGALAITSNGKYLYSSTGGLNSLSIEPATGGLTLLSQTPHTLDVGGDSYARVLALDPLGQFAFTVHMETGNLRAFRADPGSGLLGALDGFPLTLPQGVYSVGVEASGRFVYVGSDYAGISGYSLDRAHGTLTAMSGPAFPLDGLQPEMVFVTLGAP